MWLHQQSEVSRNLAGKIIASAKPNLQNTTCGKCILDSGELLEEIPQNDDQ
jgi:hypothetical protein